MRSIFDRCQPIPITGCQIWMGALNTTGYGVLRHGGRMRVAHIVAWEEHTGQVVPDGFELGHTCQVESCCEPTHVRPVTHQQNMLEGLRNMGAINAVKTHCKRGHAFDAANTYYPKPETRPHWRRCKTCERERRARSDRMQNQRRTQRNMRNGENE